MQWHEKLSFHAITWKRWDVFLKYVSDSKKWDFGDLHILKYVMSFKKWDCNQRHILKHAIASKRSYSTLLHVLKYAMNTKMSYYWRKHILAPKTSDFAHNFWFSSWIWMKSIAFIMFLRGDHFALIKNQVIAPKNVFGTPS